MDDDTVKYDFVQLGERLADSLVQAAEDQVTRAQQILDQTKSMAEIIRNQVTVQSKQIEELNARFVAFGNQMLDAHRMLNGDAPASKVTADIDQLRAMVSLERDRIHPQSGADTAGRIEPQDRDGLKLPHPLGSNQPNAAAVVNPGRHPRDNGAGGAGGNRIGTGSLASSPPYRETSTTRD